MGRYRLLVQVVLRSIVIIRAIIEMSLIEYDIMEGIHGLHSNVEEYYNFI